MEVEAKTGAATGRHPVREKPAKRYPAPEFPGCRPITIRRDELGSREWRFEFWDADTETAWVVRDVSATHEFPSHLLSALSHMIASARGSPVTCFGNMDLELRGEDGERRRIMQADQSVYLHPERSRLPDKGMVRGEHDFPDVVLEVDFTTDVRRGKLGLYEQWGFPEVWVEVPNRYSPSRPARRPMGVTIHLLEGGAYRTAPESRAFPGWTAEEIHAALNEPTVSEDTVRVLTRVGRTLGAREGTGPDDMPWLRAHRREGWVRGHAEGRAEGRAEGHAQGLAEGQAEGHAQGLAEGQAEGHAQGQAEGWARAQARIANTLRRTVLAPRGISGISDREILDALLACEGESDLLARLERPRR